MKLTAVEMHGFKSFPNRTKIEFGEGITAIIGPNGSGKSNVSDSVRWVLGEMSVKSLRGSRMEDIIFNGAAGFSPSGSASVSLILDTLEEHQNLRAQNGNEDPDPSNLVLGSFPETVITRKYYRNGDSEYYINKKQVRLKDIYELFYDTGIGREGYSVIGQGKIGEVLSQKDEDRRSIFEEAAGISKYRYKKIEAERKLKETEANLVRLDDIVAEISSRLSPLEKDAENAKAYLALSEEKKGLEVTLWLDRLDSLKLRLDEDRKETQAAKERNDELEEKVATLEKELDLAINETYELSRSSAENDRLMAEKKQSSLSLEGEKAVIVNEMSHQKRSSEENEAAATAAKVKVEEISAALEREKTKLDIVKKEYESKKADFDALMQRYTDEKNALALSLGEQSRLSAEKAAVTDTLSKKQIELAAKSAQSGAFAEKLSLAKQSVLSADEKRTQLEKALSDSEEKAKLAASDASKMRNNCAGLADEITEVAGEIESFRSTENAKKLEMAAKEQKRDSLERLERLFEGYSDSVKSLLTASRNFELRSKVYGTVSSVISVDGEFAEALECALGAAVQYVIVGDEDDAKSCIDYLKRTRSGRATFLPLTSVKGYRADVSRIKKLPGYIGIASDIIKTDDKFRGIADDLLGRTVVADNMDNAVEIAKASGYRVKIVTKDAQVIHAGGHFTGGSDIRKTGILTRALDIERLAEEIKNLNESLLEVQSKRNSLERDLQRKKDALEEARSELSELERASATRESESLSAAAAFAEAAAAYKKLTEDLEALSLGEGGAEAEILRLTEAVTALEQEQKTLEESLEKVSRDVVTRGDADRSFVDKVGEYKLELAKLQNEADRLSESAERLSTSLDESQKRVNDCLAEAANANERAEKSAQRIKELETSLTKSKLELEEMSVKQGVLAEKQRVAQERINNLRSESKTRTAEKEAAFREYTELSSKSESRSAEYAQIMEKLWDEYELTYSEADSIRLPAEKMDKASSRLSSLKNKIRSLGSINVNAVEEYRTTKERYDFLSAQIDDLNKTRKSLDNTIEKLDTSMKEMFSETFDKINRNFGEVFSELFGGGTAYVELLDPSDPLGSGIDIIVKPPGKTIKNISLLSGGEQSFAAIALYLSLQRINPAPFCIFDEIDTALDEVNVSKLADFIRKNCGKTQYIFITHRRGTMERADRLYGIMMPHKGVSEYLTLDLTKLREKESSQFELR
ncbi:MAG: chromosome segregation protein SMC [Eubacteriales bacterium]|nr:chromosome segregation protein SMC [Eubacteriales bacterium]MDD4475641.1 chromosome segregation protein SMC [Eubacteriales bacterium]